MTGYKVTLRVAAGDAERLSAALEDAIEPQAGGILAFEDADPKVWSIEVIYTQEPAKPAIEQIAEQARAPLRMLNIEALPDIDWVKKSLADLPPIRAGRFFVAGGHDLHKASGGGITLQIEAAQAFGTGSHPTTKGCLLTLDALARKGAFVNPLDLGAGSGILSFAMAKLWHVNVLGTDIDPVSVETARDYARLNRVQRHARLIAANGFRHPEIRARAPYDLIVANILAGPLVKLSRPIREHLLPGGIVVLSGLLAHQEVYVRSAFFQNGLHLLSRRVIDGWTTLTLQG